MPVEANLYRLMWRWHFYAGLAVLPFLMILAVTGAIYLFNDEINDVLQHDKRFTSSVAAQSLPLSQLAASALAAYPNGRVTRIDTPREPGRTAEIFVTPAIGNPARVFVAPETGAVLGSHVYTHTLVGFADVMHGSLLLGDFGDAVVEIAACWAVILIATGLYLWWPRAGFHLVGTFVPRASARGRSFWKSLHATVGVWTALLALFLILSGLPWATVWGGMLRTAMDYAGAGYPPSFRTHTAPSSRKADVGSDNPSGSKPWTLESEAPPRSHQHHSGPGVASTASASQSATISIDAAAEIVARHGMPDPYRLSLPLDADGVFTALRYPDRPEGQRTLYIDQYSGEVLKDVKFSDYGWAARAVELGVQIHMGNYFGRANQIVMLVPCLGILILSLTGPYMWWLRRPRGQFAAPKATVSVPLGRIILLMAIICLLFPLAGASLILVLAADSLLQFLLRHLRSAHAG